MNVKFQVSFIGIMLFGMAVIGFASAESDSDQNSKSAIAEAISYHSKLAQDYEEKIAEQDKLITEHQQMKKDYQNEYAANPQRPELFSEIKIQKFEEHCDAILAAAQGLRERLLAFSQWHRMRAAELEEPGAMEHQE